MGGDAEGIVNLSQRERPERGREGGEQHALYINKQDVGI